MCLRIALIIILIWFSTSNSVVAILKEFCLSEEFSTLTGASLTILAVLFACIYTVRTSAEHNMHNANANFCANVTDKGIREIWLEDSFKWRDFCAINTKIATMFLYSFILLAITFFITLIVHYRGISSKLEIGLCIIFLTLCSICNLIRGFCCYGGSGSKLYKSYLFSWDSVSEDDNEELKRFLRYVLNIGWAKNAVISKPDDKTISICKDEKSVKIMIVKEKKKATLKINDDKIYNLKVEKENRIYNNTGEESFLTWFFSHRPFKTDLLSYECSPRDSIFNDDAMEIYHDELSKRTLTEMKQNLKQKLEII